MNDGRYNSDRQVKARRKRMKEELIREIDACHDLENLKRLVIRIVNLTI